MIADRLERVAAAVGDPRRVLAGTDCGLETSAGNSRVADDVAWGKLAALVEGAQVSPPGGCSAPERATPRCRILVARVPEPSRHGRT